VRLSFHVLHLGRESLSNSVDPGIIVNQDLILASKAGPIKGLTMMEMLKIARVSSVEELERTFRPQKNEVVYHQPPRARKVSLVDDSSSTSKATY